MPDQGHAAGEDAGMGRGEGITMGLTCCTLVIQNEIEQGLTQKQIAMSYAMAIHSEAVGIDTPDWGAINRAISARWSEAAIKRVKKKSWKLIAEKRRQHAEFPDGGRDA